VGKIVGGVVVLLILIFGLWRIVKWTFLIGLFGLGGLGGGKKETPATTAHPATSVATPAITVPVERPWTFKTLVIPSNGLPVYLYQGWKAWPSGATTITFPDGKVVKDKPGVKNYLGTTPEGIYIFRTDPPGSDQEEQIYNRW
jgi:hypothetical protein